MKLLCDLLGWKNQACGECVYGFVYGCGAETECPVFIDKEEATDTLEKLVSQAKEALENLKKA